jgi:hypothetical protein
MKRRALCVLLASVVTATMGVIASTGKAAHAEGESAQWQQRHPVVQPPPNLPLEAMASDPANGTVVLFGGPYFSPNGAYSDATWTWDGRNWTEKHPAHHPSARGAAAMAYDPASRTVVLFGGLTGAIQNATILGDTWTWDGRDWTQQHPANQPDPHIPDMATDPAKKDVLLQGGTGVGFQPLFDTWTWDGKHKDWTQQHPAQHPANNASMAADPATHTLVAFGGGSPFSNTLSDGTWTWDGTDWTQQHPFHHPSPRVGNGLAYDPTTRAVVLFGGELTSANVGGDTWTWDGVDWTQQQTIDQPSPRAVPGMATDPATCSVVLFGGHGPLLTDFLGDTWLYTADPLAPLSLQEHHAPQPHEHDSDHCPRFEGE